MSEDRPIGPEDLERFYARQRDQILRQVEAAPIRRQDVERFYDRQREQVLARIEAEASPEVVPIAARRPATRWRLVGPLAAAAVLLLAFTPLLQRDAPSVPLTPALDDDGLGQVIIEESTGLDGALPFPAYGLWEDAEPEAVGDGEFYEGDSISSLSWLLQDQAGGPGSGDPSLPGFLEPYGLWNESDAEPEALTG